MSKDTDAASFQEFAVSQMLNVGNQTTQKRVFRDGPLEDVIAGLLKPEKTLDGDAFGDDRTAELRRLAATTPEYYLTRSEMEILVRYADEIADYAGPRVVMVQLGEVDSHKARMVLEACASPRAYVPVWTSDWVLSYASRQMNKQLPGLPVIPMVADCTDLRRLPPEIGSGANTLMFCSGATIGGFDPARATQLLSQWAKLVRRGHLLVGVDMKHDRVTMEAAYKDGDGHAAIYNLNVLDRLNRETGADFLTQAFEHVATYNDQRGCVATYLRSLRDQTVSVGGRAIAFAAGELIKTGEAFKYTVEEFQGVVRAAGLNPVKCWTDSNGRFSLHLLEKGPKFSGSLATRH